MTPAGIRMTTAIGRAAGMGLQMPALLAWLLVLHLRPVHPGEPWVSAFETALGLFILILCSRRAGRRAGVVAWGGRIG